MANGEPASVRGLKVLKTAVVAGQRIDHHGTRGWADLAGAGAARFGLGIREKESWTAAREGVKEIVKHILQAQRWRRSFRADQGAALNRGTTLAFSIAISTCKAIRLALARSKSASARRISVLELAAEGLLVPDKMS
jgi:hypothetical protein